MKKKSISKQIANITAKCIASVATVSASSTSAIYFNQPKTPVNLLKRLTK